MMHWICLWTILVCPPRRQIQIGCAETDERCLKGQQMGGDPFDQQYGSNHHHRKKRGQQMGPDWKRWKKLQQTVAKLEGLLW